MKVVVSKKFEKLLKACPSGMQLKVKAVYEKMLTAQKLSEIPSLEMLSGYSKYFRVRVGNYRIGFKLEEGQISLLAVGDRKEIYRFFP